MYRSLLTSAVLFLAVAGPARGGECAQANKIRVGNPLADGQPRVAFAALDHSAYDALLHRYVDCDGLVSYRDWKHCCADVKRLEAYLQSLAALDWNTGDAQPDARKATLINAYNALVLFGILRDYPTVSIQALNKEHAAYRIFDDLEVNLGGNWASLNGIEHELLRPLGDPRIHFAIVCAARGCPKLRNEAYVAERLNCQLDDNARDFFTSHHRWRLNRILKTATVSPILKWFREDFGSCDRDILLRIQPYLPCKDGSWIAEHAQTKIHYLGYNWALNDRSPPPLQRAAAIPYTLFARVESSVRPLVKLVRPESGSAGSSGATSVTTNAAPAGNVQQPTNVQPTGTPPADPAGKVVPAHEPEADPPPPKAIRAKAEKPMTP